LIDGTELSRATRLVRLWVERPSLPFMARKLQQLRLLEQIPRRPGRDGVLHPMPRLLRQAEILIDAMYTYRGIPHPHPDVRSLTDLIDRFDTIRRRSRRRPFLSMNLLSVLELFHYVCGRGAEPSPVPSRSSSD
jgi:hypothetical protein